MATPVEAVIQVYTRQSPRFETAADAIAYAVHAVFVSKGFRLVGLDDDVAAADRPFEGLPGQWNATGDVYSFRYRIDGGPQVIVKVLVMDTTMFVHATRAGADDVFSLELAIDDHIVQDVNLHGDPSTVYHQIDSLIALVNDRVVANFAPPAPEPRRNEDFNDLYEHDPMRIGPPRHPRMPYGGDYDDDFVPVIDPFSPLGGIDSRGGNVVGPHDPMFGRGGARGQRGGRGRGRFDPFGPDPGFGSGDPDRDEFGPPGMGGPRHFPY